MLDNNIINALKEYTKNMKNEVSFVIQTGAHEKRNELLNFLTQISSVSELISIQEDDLSLKSPISFALFANNKDTGIVFSGIPSGHEFNSLILALLQSSGTDIKLDQTISSMIKNINAPLNFEIFISLSCHNCPDVVQTLNQFTLLNDNITTEMIDGGLFQELVLEREIQGVPSVYLNGEPFANGKIEPALIINKLMEKYPNTASPVQSHDLQDVTVIGAGPAGVAAAIYSARKGLKVTLIADKIGGQVKDTIGIENLISTPKTTGSELTSNMILHLNDYEITKKEYLRVNNVVQGKIKEVHLSNNEIIKTKTIIVATGAKWRELGIPGEKENVGSGVAYCPHCDGPFFKGKDVAVIGGGNSGIEAALDLANIVNSVTVFEFMPELKADQVLQDKALQNPKITIHKNVATKEITSSNGKVDGIIYQNRENNSESKLELSGVFVQVGLVPNTGFIQDTIETNRFGEIVIDERCQTSEKGIFAAGDATTVPYKQIVIAMGEGAKASLSSFDYLTKEF